MSGIIRVTSNLLKLQRTQSVPAALYHANVSILAEMVKSKLSAT